MSTDSTCSAQFVQCNYILRKTKQQLHRAPEVKKSHTETVKMVTGTEKYLCAL